MKAEPTSCWVLKPLTFVEQCLGTLAARRRMRAMKSLVAPLAHHAMPLSPPKGGTTAARLMVEAVRVTGTLVALVVMRSTVGPVDCLSH